MTQPLDPAGFPQALAADAASRAAQGFISALPWPLSWIVNQLQGDRLDAVKVAAQRNPNAPTPSAAQLAVAAEQQRASALRGGFSALSGSSAAWDTDQGGRPQGPRAGTLGPIYQDVNAAAIPPSRLLSYRAQGRPLPANLQRGYTGPVITPGAELRRWGLSTRFPFPRIISGTLLPPGARTPSPREMVSGYMETNAGRTRLDDPYTNPEDM